MFYPQSNFQSQGTIGYPQGFGTPQSFAPQSFGTPQGFGTPPGNSSLQGYPGISNNIPFANTLYGYPQPTSTVAQGLPQMSPWQHPAQQQAQQQAALQQQAMLHLLATQLVQPFTPQHVQGANAFAGSANGAIPSTSAWQQAPVNPEQIALFQQSQQQLLQRLAQLAHYHYLVAQQLAQLAAQQATQGLGTPYTGQFIPGQLGANFVPGITMH